jgi:hypothetical protein
MEVRVLLNNFARQVFDALYECIVTTAEVLGVVFDRRHLELRGDRGLNHALSVL